MHKVAERFQLSAFRNLRPQDTCAASIGAHCSLDERALVQHLHGDELRSRPDEMLDMAFDMSINPAALHKRHKERFKHFYPISIFT